MSDWFGDTRSSAARFVRMEGTRAMLLRPNISPWAKAAAFAVLFTLVAVSLLIIIPLMVMAGLVFVASLVVLKIKQLLTGTLMRLPRDEGRRNVRVRLPEDVSE